jgi:hypothetical protein
MLLQAIICVGLKSFEYFCIGMLYLPIAFWTSNRSIANLDAKIFAVPLKGTSSKSGPVVSDDPVWDPESAYDRLDEFHCGRREPGRWGTRARVPALSFVFTWSL